MMWYLRQATNNDIEPCQQLGLQWRHELGGLVRRDRLQRGVAKAELYVACEDNQIVGFINWHRRLDGWSTVYELAVDRDRQGQGIGRALLYAVPAPIRLKCPVDNASNVFYAGAGMQLAQTEAGNKRALNVWQLPILPILTAGGNKRFPAIARQSGMAYGSRHDYRPEAWPFMMDIKWDDYDWQDYLAKLKRWQPVFALVPDYEEHISRKQMLAQVDDLRGLGIFRVGVCIKKRGGIADIPQDCVVCISVPAPKYAGYLPHPDERPQLRGRMLHFLGGTPRQWFGSKRRYPGDEGNPNVGLVAKFAGYGAQVISIDGNSHQSASNRGSVWSGGRWLRPVSGWMIEGEGKNYQTMAQSGVNIVRQMATQTVSQPPLF